MTSPTELSRPAGALINSEEMLSAEKAPALSLGRSENRDRLHPINAPRGGPLDRTKRTRCATCSGAINGRDSITFPRRFWMMNPKSLRVHIRLPVPCAIRRSHLAGSLEKRPLGMARTLLYAVLCSTRGRWTEAAEVSPCKREAPYRSGPRYKRLRPTLS